MRSSFKVMNSSEEEQLESAVLKKGYYFTPNIAVILSNYLLNENCLRLLVKPKATKEKKREVTTWPDNSSVNFTRLS